MWTTDNQRELNTALDLLYKEQGAQFASGYANSLAVEMLTLLPKRKQKEFIKQVTTFNGRQLVKVKHLFSGAEVEIRRSDVGTCIDPSTERFHSM
jgi:hypothetical protein